MKKILNQKGLAALLTVTTLVTGGVIAPAPFLNSSVYATAEAAKELPSEKQLYRFLFENSIEDSSESHYPVQVFGTPTFVEGRVGLGKSIHFQSTSKDNATWIDLGENDEMKFGETQDFTIAFWVKSPGVDADPGIISNKNWSSGGNVGWFIGLQGSTLKWNWRTSDSSRLDATIPNIADNAWHYVVVSHDRGELATIYVDGKVAKTIDISQSKGTIDTSFTTKIGVDGAGNHFGNRYDVQLDQLQILSRTVTDEEVADSYASAPKIPVKSISLDQKELELKAGATMPVTVVISPKEASVQDVRWSSNNKEVAKVEMVNGRPTVVAGKPGKAKLTVKTVDGGKTAKAEVIVTNSIDVSGDGLLTEEDLNVIMNNQKSRFGDRRWEKAQHADINNDKKVDKADVEMMKEKLAPYENEFLYRRVVVIGIDGAGNAVKDPEAKATNILKLIEEGAGTFEAKAELPTISAQNWGSILHGVTPDKHQLTNDSVAATPYPEKNEYPSYMKLLKQERPKLQQASFATWSPINIGIIEDSAGSYKQNSGSDEATAKKVVDYIKKEGENTRNIFVHLDEVDGAGHNQGYFTPAFYKKLQKADEYVGNILEALEEEGLMEDSLIIITTDHGGKGTGHGGSSPGEQTIFWAAKGGSITPGTELSEVVNTDTAAVVAHALRLELPENWDAKIPEGLFQDNK
ncbi:alkaline phosphatase family protein [Brevibacillus sp. M2.1A]|uniref:alkaline phosphatase family protein n=1 Tax=Brevibacillus TaxID=55080 RepID=UPI00156B547A|nr:MULTISPECIES: alkaline phosphatase family protein [Brevibacillus]MCC8434790.1 alkaline phosphatase family protein [Brevibacillus sp. M2.1A]UKK97188.1 sulfatase-like hydrolase/transferase [Brevibacillus brevis]